MDNIMASSGTNFRNAEHGIKLAEGNNQFALDLYKAVTTVQDGNVFFSPGSISIAMAMTFLGARNNTAKEMKSAMSLNKLDDGDVHATFEDLCQVLKETKGHCTLHIANRLFGEKSYQFIQEFMDKQNKHYQATLAQMDFKNDFEAARAEINHWVEHETSDKIKDLLLEGTINSLTRLVLVNAIYFKGDWALKFDSKNTEPGSFYVTPQNKVEVPMMRMKKKFRYGTARALNNCQVIEIPYEGKKLSMFILLPRAEDTVDGLVGMLKPEHLMNPMKSFMMRLIDVTLMIPRFKLEQSFNLGDILVDMGMRDLFTAGKADLSGMDGTKELVVSSVVHKAFIEVNEEGSEAAAATGATLMLCSMPMPPPEFFLNRPALFFIQDDATKTLLFFGRLVNPSEK